MSNQVFSSPVPRFFPNTDQADKFTLIKNTVGPPALGYTNKPITKAGCYLYWNMLNDLFGTNAVECIRAQNDMTRPYWSVTQVGLALNGATALFSKVDNLIQVSVVLPCWLQAGSVLNGAYVKLTAHVLDPANSYAVVSSHGFATTQAMSSAGGGPISAIFISPQGNISLDCTVEVRAGLALAIFATVVYPTDPNQAFSLVIQDDANSTGTLQTACSVTFRKV
jgi:hypothetical protein